MKKILVIDIGGTEVKLMISRKEKRKFDSGPKINSKQMIAQIRKIVADWEYGAISIGFPAPVRDGKIVKEPKHLGKGWVGWNPGKSLGKPVRLINDAAMQALGSYEGGRMLFLGLGTGLGSAVIVDGALEPMELAHLPYKRGRTYEDCVGAAGLKRSGKKKWRRRVLDVIALLRHALQADDVVIGGGNAKLLRELPANVRLGTNVNAFVGGYRLWKGAQRRPARSAHHG